MRLAVRPLVLLPVMPIIEYAALGGFLTKTALFAFIFAGSHGVNGVQPEHEGQVLSFYI